MQRRKQNIQRQERGILPQNHQLFQEAIEQEVIGKTC